MPAGEDRLPPISDPARYLLFIHNAHAHLPPRNKQSQQSDGGRILEFQGDKYFSGVASRLCERFGLPHSWGATLIATFSSNKYMSAVSSAQGFDRDLLGTASGKVLANSVEVLPN